MPTSKIYAEIAAQEGWFSNWIGSKPKESKQPDMSKFITHFDIKKDPDYEKYEDRLIAIDAQISKLIRAQFPQIAKSISPGYTKKDKWSILRDGWGKYELLSLDVSKLGNFRDEKLMQHCWSTMQKSFLSLKRIYLKTLAISILMPKMSFSLSISDFSRFTHELARI